MFGDGKMAHSTGSTGSPFPKWQLAVALGATGAIGLGYWYMKNYSLEKSKKHSKGSLLELGKKSCSSVDESTESKTTVEKTPLQIALQYKAEGNDFFKKGTYDKAIACYTKAIEECPVDNRDDLATFYQNRAAAYEHLKKYSSVIDDCTKALECKTNYVKALYRRARAYEAIKNWSDCLDDVSAVCLLQAFQDQSALVMADRVLKELGRKHANEAIANRIPVTPSKHFIKTYFLSFSEDPAYNLINSDLAVQSEDEATGFLRARKAFLDRNFDDVIPACTEEIDSSEAESQYKLEALLLRGTFHLLRGTHDEALEDLQAVISNEQADVKLRVSALIKRASLYMQLEKQDECIKDFDQAAELGPNISDVFHHRGQVHLLMDKIEEATKDFDRAVDLNPNFPIAYVQKCYTDYRQALNARDVNKVQKCMNNFASATEKFPQCPECYILYAQVLADQQKYEKADEYYEKALALDNTNATVLVHKGLLTLQWTGDTEKAVELMQTAIERDPLCEFAYETLATVEVQRLVHTCIQYFYLIIR